jgi:hypothetical protein
MSEHDNLDEMGELLELDAEIAALLADPAMWGGPSPDVGDRISAAIQAEAALGPPAASPTATTASAPAWLRPALLGAAAAVALLLGGIVALSAVSGVDDNETFAAELTSTGLVADVSGDVEIVALQSGLRIDLDAASLPRRDGGDFYQGWLKTVEGNLIPVGSFHSGENVTMWAGIGLAQVEAFTITREQATGGNDVTQGTSGEVVLRAVVGG